MRLTVVYEERPLEFPKEWGGIIPSKVFFEEARRAVEAAEKENIILRVMGGVGIGLHSLNRQDFAMRLRRLATGEQEFSDLDFMAYKSQRKLMEPFFKEIGYIKRRATLSTAASERQIYFHNKGWFFVDVFFDKLVVANHPIDFRGRLELDSPTVTVTDLLLEKLQIVNFSEKDYKDTLLLLHAHEVGKSDEGETINAQYIAKILASDWGFYHTVTTNLKNLAIHVKRESQLTIEEAEDIALKATRLLDYMDKEPKTTRWKLRAMIGPRMKWYEVVESSETVGEFGIWKLRNRESLTGNTV